MRIALISEHASPLAVIGGVDAGGQNVYVAHVARCLAEQGHEVDVFTRQDDPLLAPVVDLGPGLRVVHVRAGSLTHVPKEQLLGLMPRFASVCEAWMRRSRRYDVIHANFFMSGWVGLRLKQIFGVPVVTTFHALGKVRREHQREADAFPPERIEIERSLVKESDRIIAECPQDLLDLQRLYDADVERIEMIPCGFDAREFQPMRREEARAILHIPASEFTVLQLGRIVPRKGIDTVVRAMASLRHPETRLRIVGGDCDAADPWRTSEIRRLEAIAHECGVADRVIFEGRKPRGQLKYWYAAANVFVTTPWYEPFGITPLEAMACARPVIASRVGGLQYSIDEGVTGMLVPPKDHEALAAAVAQLRSKPVLAGNMGRAGVERVRKHFAWENIAGQLGRVFAAAATPSRQIASSQMLTAVPAALPPESPANMTSQEKPAGTGRAASPAIFLDRDGTLIEDVPFNVNPERVRLTPHAIEALRLWRDSGYRLIVVTNQPGVGRGLFDLSALHELHLDLNARLARVGVPLDGFFICPHRAEANCSCRKPQPGLLIEAARRLDVDLSRSWMVGDILNDVEAGHRAGCRSVLLDVGHETEWLPGELRVPEHLCRDLLQAAWATSSSTALVSITQGTLPDIVAAA